MQPLFMHCSCFIEYKLTYLFNNVQDHKNAHSKMERKRSKIKLIREIFNHHTQVDHSCQNLEKKLCREISSSYVVTKMIQFNVSFITKGKIVFEIKPHYIICSLWIYISI